MLVRTLGFDIGGTKCSVVLGEFPDDGGVPRILEKRRFATAQFSTPEACVAELCRLAEGLLEAYPERASVRGVGISCGGPLDAKAGLILGPPNLPGWNCVPVVEWVRQRLGIPAYLENDANACALAEWKFGAGRGTSDMIFLTFGTGMGAGIIAQGTLLSGCSGLAGEVGHIRLDADGPEGYGKCGSFEGFCSGGGLARQGRAFAESALRTGHPVPWCATVADLDSITAQRIAEAALAGDPDARRIYADCGARLGQGLALLMDILNPECIVIGSIFVRAEPLLRPSMERVLTQECLPSIRHACRILPAALGETIGDMAALVLGHF